MREIWRKLPWLMRLGLGLAATAVVSFILQSLLGHFVPREKVAGFLIWLLGCVPVAVLLAFAAGVFALPVVTFLGDRAPRWRARVSSMWARLFRFRPTPISLPFEQEHLLILIDRFQKQFRRRKLVIGRDDGQVHLDREPQPAKPINLVVKLFGSASPENGARFKELMDSMPTDYLRFYAEMRWDSPFVVAITDAGKAYLAERARHDQLIDSISGRGHRLYVSD